MSTLLRMSAFWLAAMPLAPALAAEGTAPAPSGPARNPQQANVVSTGASFFVARNGNDRNPGTIDQPFATLYKACSWVRPGETINFRAGTYEASITWYKSGTPTAPITIQAYNGEDVTLISSEQFHTWKHVVDATFGDCWKLAIPYRPIRYRGLQHTLWEDAESAVTIPGNFLWAIVKDGYPCAPMHSAADFALPQAAPHVRLTNDNGKLLYDITWYDRNAKTLWFKPGPSQVTDPNRQLYVTGPSSGQFSIAGSYLKLIGLKFKYLCFLHQQDNPTGCDIDRCQIKHADFGIIGGGAHCTYTSLFVDKIGTWLCWRNGGYEQAFVKHGLYFNGSHCLVSNCFFGRSNEGGPIQNYPDGTVGNRFDGNVLYNCSGGSIFMGQDDNSITNNISLQKGYGISPYVSMQGFTIANNYSEGANPITFGCQEAGGFYKETFERFAITRNVFNNTGADVNAGAYVEYRGNIVNARQCNIDGNVYLGKQCWLLGLTQEEPPRAARGRYASFASYVAALRAMPHAADWEKKSQASPQGPHFDFAAFDAYLDSDPPLADVLLKIRRYVKGVIAPYPGAGPVLKLP